MADDYPYMVSNNKIAPILDQIERAEKPSRFSHVFLKKLGFSSSNDRAVIPLMKRLGFITENGNPTEFYDDLKDGGKRFHVLAERLRDLYSELFSIDTKINEASDDAIKGAISRVTGKDAKAVARYFATFKTLLSLADFSAVGENKTDEKSPVNEEKDEGKHKTETPLKKAMNSSEFHYNIQIHLPATTDISVYNAIFKSLKENLNI